jgi:leucyl-tRNA synthetase
VHRFLQKVWRELVGEDGGVNAKLCAADPGDAAAIDLKRLLHETIRKVGEDIEGLRFNTAISQMMIFANALQKAPRIEIEVARTFLRLLAPFSPHIAEELWSRLGGTGFIQQAGWPVHDPKLLEKSEVKLVFQVNGKFRGDQLVPVGMAEAEAVSAARAHLKVAPHLDGKNLVRVIYVPGKILNLVVS